MLFPNYIRLGIHNELCALKWKKPSTWLREGFLISTRIDSMKRHYESIHAREESEDHIAHLIWGFMAVVHVVACFPQMNDLYNLEKIRRLNVSTVDEDVQSLVGDGGFRPVRPSSGDHSSSNNKYHAAVESVRQNLMKTESNGDSIAKERTANQTM